MEKFKASLKWKRAASGRITIDVTLSGKVSPITSLIISYLQKMYTQFRRNLTNARLLVNKYSLVRSVGQLRYIFVVYGWYRRLVRNFASVTIVFFEQFKEQLCSAPLLHKPHFTRPYCDLSQLKAGSVMKAENHADYASLKRLRS